MSVILYTWTYLIAEGEANETTGRETASSNI